MATPEIIPTVESSPGKEEEVLTDVRSKAALVVVSLGADRASQIYKYLNEQDIEDLTYEVAKLGRTTNSQVESTLDEFYPQLQISSGPASRRETFSGGEKKVVST